MLASNFTFALKKTRASSRNVGKVSFRVSWYSENFPLVSYSIMRALRHLPRPRVSFSGAGVWQFGGAAGKHFKNERDICSSGWGVVQATECTFL